MNLNLQTTSLTLGDGKIGPLAERLPSIQNYRHSLKDIFLMTSHPKKYQKD